MTCEKPPDFIVNERLFIVAVPRNNLSYNVQITGDCRPPARIEVAYQLLVIHDAHGYPYGLYFRSPPLFTGHFGVRLILEFTYQRQFALLRYNFKYNDMIAYYQNHVNGKAQIKPAG